MTVTTAAEPRDRVRRHVLDLMTIGEIMRAVATSEISCSDPIDGTWLDYLSRQIKHHTAEASNALDEMRRGVSA